MAEEEKNLTNYYVAKTKTGIYLEFGKKCNKIQIYENVVLFEQYINQIEFKTLGLIPIENIDYIKAEN